MSNRVKDDHLKELNASNSDPVRFADVLESELAYIESRRQLSSMTNEEIGKDREIVKAATELANQADCIAKQNEEIAKGEERTAEKLTRALGRAARNRAQFARTKAREARISAESARQTAREAQAKLNAMKAEKDAERDALRALYEKTFRHIRAQLIAARDMTAWKHEFSAQSEHSGNVNVEATPQIAPAGATSESADAPYWKDLEQKTRALADDAVKAKIAANDARAKRIERLRKDYLEASKQYADFAIWQCSQKIVEQSPSTKEYDLKPSAPEDKRTEPAGDDTEDGPEPPITGIPAPSSGSPPDAAPQTKIDDLRDRFERERNQFFLKHARDTELVGLALSGGGIRSATFNLGFLQGLADFGLLRHLDYISTVSGGGYIGSWLAAWIHRERRLDDVEKQLRSKRVDQAKGFQPPRDPQQQELKEEPAPIVNLRTYSSYLAPHQGLGSIDAWVLLVIYLRNLILNHLVLLPLLLSLILAPRFLHLSFVGAEESRNPLGAWILIAAFLLPVIAALAIWKWSLLPLNKIDSNLYLWFRALLRRPFVRNTFLGRFVEHGSKFIQLDALRLRFWVVLPLVCACVVAAWLVWPNTRPETGWIAGVIDVLNQRIDKWVVHLPQWRYAIAFGLTAAVMSLFLYILIFSVDCIVLLAMIVGRAGKAVRMGRRLCDKWERMHFLRRMFSSAASSFICGGLAGLIHANAFPLAIKSMQQIDEKAYKGSIVVTLGPPLVILLVCFAIVIWIGLMGTGRAGRDLPFQSNTPLPRAKLWLATKQQLDSERELWASVSGNLLMVAAAWLVVFGLALFVVPIVTWLKQFAPALNYSAVAAWLLTTLTGVALGQSRFTGKDSQNSVLNRFVTFTPWLYIVGALTLVSYTLSQAVDSPPIRSEVEQYVEMHREPISPPNKVVETLIGGAVQKHDVTREHIEYPDDASIDVKRYWLGLFVPLKASDYPIGSAINYGATFYRWASILGILLAVCALFSSTVGVNTFSLQNMYANRLVRCYLGASRLQGFTDNSRGIPPNVAPPRRNPNPITGFDANDDFALADLVGRRDDEERKLNDNQKSRGGPGPYLLINTAMNLVEDADLAWQERKATSFVLTPHFCGSDISGYRPTCYYAGNLRLGVAMAISGAAASPNMGYHSSPAVTAMLTTFNVRLGSWMPNPAVNAWKNPEPLFSLFMLLKEVLGRTDRHGRFVYLSDGGHFENLGAYELVRRQCRYIIVCDAGADPNYEFFDLAGLIRKCRIDFGVPIEIETSRIKPEPDGYSKWHCAIGTIRYDAIDPLATPGVLLYIKNSLTGDEPSDVRGYQKSHPAFPHESTADQFFTESQFESYRALGLHVAHEALGQAMSGVESADYLYDYVQRRVSYRLFSNLRTIWCTRPPDLERNYLESVKAWVDVNSVLRTDDNVRDFSLAMYPEVSNPLKGKPTGVIDQARAELQVAGQMLQMMESAYFGLQLDKYHALPINRGWMNAFRRWTTANTMRAHWVKLRGEYSQDFVRFCETELNLDPGEPTIFILDQSIGARLSPDFIGLQKEFEQDWPAEDTIAERLPQVVVVEGPDMPLGKLKHGEKLAWLIAVVPKSDPQPDKWTNQKYICGIVFVEQREASKNEFTLFTWIRGAYRHLNIGRRALNRVLESVIVPQLQRLRNRKLCVRFPDAIGENGLISNQAAGWLCFYQQYGFRREDRPGTRDLYLVRDI